MLGSTSQEMRRGIRRCRSFPLEILVEAVRRARSGGPSWLSARPPFPPGTPRLVDLRSRAAFEERHIPGSCSLAAEEIDLPFLRPPRARPLVLIGNTDRESRSCAERLRSAGYTAMPLDAPVSRWTGPWESGPEAAPVWEPSPLVARWADRLPLNRVLDLACGSARDGVYLAMRGAEVTGIDHLPDALEQAAHLARRHGVRLRLLREDIEKDASSWAGSWSTINVQRFLHRPALRLFHDRITEGGYLLYETFLRDQERVGRKPRSRAHLLTAGELHIAARGLSVLAYREGPNDSGDWTAALIARKGDGRA